MTDQLLPEFQPLFAAPGLPRFDLPATIDRAYGTFGLAPQLTYGNFVSSLDGIVAIPGVPRSSALISGGDPADRFVVALLRAVADVVVIGAGTFRAHEGPWTGENAFPEGAESLVELRKKVGLSEKPTLVVVTASGDLGGRAKLQDMIVITTSQGVDRIGKDVAAGASVVELGATASIDLREVVGWLFDHGYRRLLTEGGPRLMGEALKSRIVDELFLTISPALVGGGGRPPRPTLASGVDLLSDAAPSARLVSLHRKDSFLFLRYSLVEVTPS